LRDTVASAQGTQARNRKGHRHKVTKKGRIRSIFGNDRLDEMLEQLLNAPSPNDRLYVYRLHQGKPVRPAMIIGSPFSDLMEVLRDQYGGGEFQVMIRRGETMLLSGAIAIHPPLKLR